jgi:acyl-CoA synthetase (AMP-forming)/AMP-acid ligase II
MNAPTTLGALTVGAPDPSKTALIDLGGGAPRRYSFAELDDVTNGVARALLARGLQAGERVAIVSDNRMEFLAAYEGVMRAGLVVVPVNCRLPAAMVEYVLRDSGTRIVLADTPRRALCPTDLPVIEFGTDGPEGFDAFLDGGCFTPAPVAPGDAAVILYTSGSTGRPKGVVLSHAAYLWSTLGRVAAIDFAPHRLLVAAPLYHMNALNTVQLALAGQATMVLLPRFEAATYVEAIQRHQITWLTAIPTMIAMLARLPSVTHADLASVRVLRMGSEPITQRIIDAARALFTSASIANGYGTTETGAVVFGAHPQGLTTPDMALGYPHPEVQLRLVRGTNLDAEEGVLQVKSPALMNGYHGRPDLSSAVMTQDGYYITGDVVRRGENGFYYFVGRSDDMFVCGGENVFPIEVESMLERHPDIQRACVVAMVDALKGKKPVAAVMLRPGAIASVQSVKEFALKHGPAYQHPREVHFVGNLPVSGTDKIDRKAVMALVQRLSTTTA